MLPDMRLKNGARVLAPLEHLARDAALAIERRYDRGASVLFKVVDLASVKTLLVETSEDGSKFGSRSNSDVFHEQEIA